MRWPSRSRSSSRSPTSSTPRRSYRSPAGRLAPSAPCDLGRGVVEPAQLGFIRHRRGHVELRPQRRLSRTEIELLLGDSRLRERAHPAKIPQAFREYERLDTAKRISDPRKEP